MRWVLALGLLAGSLGAQDSQPAAPARCDLGLRDAREPVPVFVRMADQVFARGGEFERFCSEHATTKRSTLRARTIADLKARSERSWEQVRAVVAQQEQQQALSGVQRYWLVNGFAADANGAAVQALLQRPEVAYVHRQTQPGRAQHKTSKRAESWLSERRQDQATALALRAEAASQPAATSAPSVPWNLAKIRADRAWEQGAQGQGVVIALLDSGVLPIPPLVRALWRNPREEANGRDDDGNGYVDDLFGWDFDGNTPFVVGDGPNSHGTMCGGILAGRAFGAPSTVTGVAPRAELMVLRGMGCLAAYEYAAQMGADVLSMSYMWISVELGSYRGVFRTAHEHLAACGIVAVGGAGNFGRSAPEGEQIALPKDIPCVIAAAGIGRDGSAPAFSSRGPCTWNDVPFFSDYPPGAPLEKPDVTGVCSGVPVWHWTRMRGDRPVQVQWEDGHGTGLIVGPQGNSFAGPHAGGVAALVLGVNPELTPWRVKAILEQTCLDLGDKGRDRVYGAGLLQADAAVSVARAAKVE